MARLTSPSPNSSSTDRRALSAMKLNAASVATDKAGEMKGSRTARRSSCAGAVAEEAKG